ncbi:MAG: DoxX family membrane protein [Crocinitomicaceae bacterium]|nr:DoxX family membrane protein [Crocinitomicaceae bacterium]
MSAKNRNISVGGRSYFFNVLFVLLNIFGLTLITIAYHDSFSGSSLGLKLIGFTLMALATAGLLIFRGRLMMANVSRVLIGGLFIVSGLVKANDPLGFAYKLEEYFEDGALAYRIKEWFGAPGFSLEFLIDYALPLSVIICIIEIIIGIFLIIGEKIKPVSYLLVFMMAFFTFLTWHTATCDSGKKFKDRDTYALSNPIAAIKIKQAETNKDIKIVSQNNEEVVIDEMKQPQCVDDCGCFGDAMKGSIGRSLTPKESLWKDIIVFYLGMWIFIAQWLIVPNERKQNVVFATTSLLVIAFFSMIFSWYFPIIFGLIGIVGALWIKRSGGVLFGNYFGMGIFLTILSSIFVFFVLRYEPMKDYRPYAQGSNLVELMNNGEEGIYQSMLRYVNKNTKEERLYDSSSPEYMKSKIWDDENWEYVDMVQKTIKATKLPSITEQFNPFIAIQDMTDYEKNLSFVNEFIASNGIQIVHVKNLSSNDIYDVPMDEFTLEEYSPNYYQVLDTVTEVDPELTDVNIRNYITTTDEIIILTTRDIFKANWDAMDRYKSILEGAKKHGIPMILLSSSNRKDINNFRKKYNFNIPIFTNDEIELKAIARSNPSMMVIQKGIVKGKYPHRSTPTFGWLEKNILLKQ